MQAGFSCRSIASISTAPMAQCRLEYCCEGRSWKNFMPAAPAQTLPAGRLISAWKRTERVSRDGCAEGGCRKSRKSTGGTWWTLSSGETRLGKKPCIDRKSTRLNSSHLGISYAVFCLKKKNNNQRTVANFSTVTPSDYALARMAAA